jgi:hypothetical protein
METVAGCSCLELQRFEVHQCSTSCLLLALPSKVPPSARRYLLNTPTTTRYSHIATSGVSGAP